MSAILVGLTEDKIILTETVTYKLWESAGKKLVEAQLTADQISQIFQTVQQDMTAAGGNRNIIGKGMDAASAVNNAWEDLKGKIQNTGPIKNFDQKVSDVLGKIGMGAADPEFNGQVNKWVQKYRDFAKEHPVVQGAIYATLIGLAGISGAGIGGAAALGLLKMADQLIQGKRFSSAAYQGAKTGAMAYGASKVGDYIKGKMSPNSGATGNTVGYNIEVGKPLPDGSIYAGETDTSVYIKYPGSDKVTIMDKDKFYDALIKGEPIGQNVGSTDGWSTPKPRTTQSSRGNANFDGWGSDPSSIKLTPLSDAAKEKAAQSFADSMGITGPLEIKAIGSVPVQINGVPVPQHLFTQNQLNLINAAKNLSGKMPTSETKSIVLSNSQIKKLFEQVVIEQQLNEGLWDTIKGKAGQALDYVDKKYAQGAEYVGKKVQNLGTKVTADKLMQVWKGAGSPTDSAQIIKLLTQNGVSQDIVNSVFAKLKIPTKSNDPAPAPTSISKGVAQATTKVPGTSTSFNYKNLTGNSATKFAESTENQDNLQFAFKQAKDITKQIKYDNTVRQIITEIELLAEKNRIDKDSLETAIQDVITAQRQLEAAVYGLDGVFEEAMRQAQFSEDLNETDLVENIKPDELADALLNKHPNIVRRYGHEIVVKAIFNILKNSSEQDVDLLIDNIIELLKSSEHKTDEGQIYSTGGGAGEGLHKYKIKPAGL